MARFNGIPVDAPPAGAAVPAKPRFAGTPVQQIDPAAQMAYLKEHGIPGYGMEAFADQAIQAVPFIGGWLHDQGQNLRGAVSDALRSFGLNTPTGADMNAGMDMAVKGSPVEAMAGQVFGQTAPLALAGGSIPLVGKLLGMTGSLPARLAASTISGGGILAGDTLARGGSLDDARNAGITGALMGPAATLGGEGLGLLAKTFAPSGEKVLTNVARALKDDGLTPNQIKSKLADLGPDAMVMDLGPNLQAQAGALAASPGKGATILRGAVDARGAGARARVTNDVASTIGSGPDVEELAAKVTAAQKAQSAPLYDAVRHQPLPMSGNFAFVFKTPMGQKALREAATMMANDGHKVTGLTVGLVDYAKQALDDAVQVAKRAGEGNKARQATNLANVLRNEADKWSPGYAQAREAFAGPAKVKDAITLGNTVWTKEMSPYQLQHSLDGMSASERDAFLQGARGSIEAQMGNAVNDPLALRNTFKKGWNEAKLRMVLGNEVADDLLKRINREVVFGKTANAVSGNSETARRAAAMGEVSSGGGDMHVEGTVGLLTRAFNAARKAVRGYNQTKVNAGMAATLASKGAGLSPELLQQMQGGAARLPRVPAIAPASVPLALTGLGRSALQS